MGSNQILRVDWVYPQLENRSDMRKEMNCSLKVTLGALEDRSQLRAAADALVTDKKEVVFNGSMAGHSAMMEMGKLRFLQQQIAVIERQLSIENKSPTDVKMEVLARLHAAMKGNKLKREMGTFIEDNSKYMPIASKVSQARWA